MAAAFESFVIWAERITRKQLLVFHNDKGRNFISRQILDFCKKCGIRCKFTETGKPYQNGVAERANLDISNSASTLLNEAKLPMTILAGGGVRMCAYIQQIAHVCTPPRQNTRLKMVWQEA